jgi:hypothetical protein
LRVVLAANARAAAFCRCATSRCCTSRPCITQHTAEPHRHMLVLQPSRLFAPQLLTHGTTPGRCENHKSSCPCLPRKQQHMPAMPACRRPGPKRPSPDRLELQPFNPHVSTTQTAVAPYPP